MRSRIIAREMIGKLGGAALAGVVSRGLESVQDPVERSSIWRALVSASSGTIGAIVTAMIDTED
jgi:hypothetical protein